MAKPSAVVQKRLASTSLGVFDANSWIEEGDGLAASSRSLRARWLCLKRQIRARRTGPRRDEWSALTGNPRASVLLLGYAIEMYLKAGLAKWLSHCPEYLLLGDTKYYSHDYKLLADDLGIDETVAPRDLLNKASDFLHHPHHNNDCSRDLIKQVREFLAHAGVSLSAYEAKKTDIQ